MLLAIEAPESELARLKEPMAQHLCTSEVGTWPRRRCCLPQAGGANQPSSRFASESFLDLLSFFLLPLFLGPGLGGGNLSEVVNGAAGLFLLGQAHRAAAPRRSPWTPIIATMPS